MGLVCFLVDNRGIFWPEVIVDKIATGKTAGVKFSRSAVTYL